MSIFTKKLPFNLSTRLYSSVYKSSISLEQLYPNSPTKIQTIEPPKAGGKPFSGFIPVNELDISYSKSSGPGGQNVNKVNTKVEVRFNVSSASWIHEDIRGKLLEKCKTSLTKEGFIVFRSDITRSQQLNLADCLEKIRSLVRSCEVTETAPSEETLEKLRKRHEKATRERLSIKRVRSQTKTDRQSPQL